MRAAAAALAGALLFFLGTVAAGPGPDRGSPLQPIPLGTAPETAGEPPPADARAGDGGAPAGDGTGAGAPAGTGGGAPPASSPPASSPPASSPPTGEPPAPTPSSGPGGGAGTPPPSGDVEEVDNEVDCVEVGGGRGRAEGREDACPPAKEKPLRSPTEARGRGGDGDGAN